MYAYLGIWPVLDSDGNAYAPGTPEAEKAGTPLAGGKFLVVWGLTSDLDHLAKAFGLEHYTGNLCCVFCPASQSVSAPKEELMNNFNPSAKWAKLVYTWMQWRRMTLSCTF